jgi:hypothetical protein
MTEAEWHGCMDPTPMLEFLRGRASERKLRLFAAACVRLHWGLLIRQRSRDAVALSEEVADGTGSAEALAAAYRHAWEVLPQLADRDAIVLAARAAGRTVEQEPFDAANWTKNEIVELHAGLAMEGAGSEDEENRLYWEGKAKGKGRLALLLRDIFAPFWSLPPLSAPILAWNGGSLAQLVQAASDERLLPSGELDPVRLSVLADALEEAGADAVLVAHLREPGPHWRGCWAVDAVLGKE